MNDNHKDDLYDTGRAKAKEWSDALTSLLDACTDADISYQITEEGFIMVQTEIGGALVNFSCQADMEGDYDDDESGALCCEEEDDDEGEEEEDDDFEMVEELDGDEDEDEEGLDGSEFDELVHMILQVPIMPLPKKRLDAFFRKVLELNTGLLCPGRLAVDSDMLVLDMGLNVDFIAKESLLEIILSVIATAPVVATELIMEFGVKMFPWLKDA